MTPSARRATAPLGYRFLAGVVVLATRLLRWRVDAAGLEHVPGSSGAVLTWNHTGHLDVVVTAVSIWEHRGRWVRFLALREFFDRAATGWALRLARCVPVERDSDDGRDEALRDAVAALRDGHLVMVAPEGTISTSLELLPFRTGAVRMAQAARVPVVPTVSWGSHRFVTTGRAPSLRRGWRLPVTVRFGEPFEIAADDDPVAATEELRRRTQLLLDEARAAHPGVASA